MLRKGKSIPLHPMTKKWSLRGQFPLVLEASSVIVQNRKQHLKYMILGDLEEGISAQVIFQLLETVDSAFLSVP